MTDLVPVEELDSALLHIVQLLTDRNQNDVAWWLCANHPKFLLDHPYLGVAKIVVQAEAAGSAPDSGTWQVWFERIRRLRRA